MLADKKTYEELLSDSTPKYKRKLVSTLSMLKKESKISEGKKWLYPTAENIPLLYCTPKIHKTGTPLHPIVDYTNTTGYCTSRWLADILGALVGKTKHHVQNSKYLTDELAKVVIDEEDILNSHDVVCEHVHQYTDWPSILSIVKDRLENEDIFLRDYSKEQGFKLTSDDVVNLQEFILTTTYFTFRGKIYRQLFGTAMRSPVSLIAATIFMEALELLHPPHGLLSKAMVSLCTQHPWNGAERLCTEADRPYKSGRQVRIHPIHLWNCQDGKIPFLDILIVKKEDGSVKLLTYRKPTHTDQYLNYKSHHPLHQKMGVIRTLFDKKDRIVTEDDDKIQEGGKVVHALQNCGYPQWVFKKVKDQMKVPKKQNTSKKVDSTNKSRGMVVIPYVQGVSQRVTEFTSPTVFQLLWNCTTQRTCAS